MSYSFLEEARNLAGYGWRQDLIFVAEFWKIAIFLQFVWFREVLYFPTLAPTEAHDRGCEVSEGLNIVGSFIPVGGVPRNTAAELPSGQLSAVDYIQVRLIIAKTIFSNIAMISFVISPLRRLCKLSKCRSRKVILQLMKFG